MSSSNMAATRTCPVCDAKNSNLSLFCAECGASLNAPAEGDTSAFEPVPAPVDDSQQTAAFEPSAANVNSTTSTRKSDSVTSVAPIAEPEKVASYPSMWDTGTSTVPASDQVWPVQPEGGQADHRSPDLGMRGFFLGLIAVLLILAVALTWGWASIISQDTRDSISDFFGFIG